MIDRRYELEALPLAKGGMGEVWVGRDVKLDREIAVKFVRFPDGRPDEELVRRFIRESRITARLVHPGVPAVYDAGTHEGRPYLVMQRVHGISVADLVAEQGALPIGWAAAIAAQAASVLAVAHRASLVHRDLKPANLMLEPDGTVKVLDFGLAVALDRTDLSKITLTGQHLGSPAYMAPEQVLAGLSAPATDLYALGATLFEMLTGRRLFAGSSSYSVMHQQVEEVPARVRTLRADVPAGLDGLVADLLRKAPEERPSGAEAVYEALIGWMTDLVPLPGIVDPAADNTVRMYNRITARVHPSAPAPSRPTTTAPTSPVPGPDLPGPDLPGPGVREPARSDAMTVPGLRSPSSSGIDQVELRRARDEARSLAGSSRYSQATAILAEAVDRAGRALGIDSPDALALRLELAELLFEGGDFRQAVGEYERLVADLARRDGRNSERLMLARLREATCRALIGDTPRALEQLGALLPDETRVFGADDPRVLELRRQIGLLQLGAGHRAAAAESLAALLADLLRVWGPEHPMVPVVRELLAGAHGTAVAR
ncbi:serine/threonine-protein kinase [Frankia sp. QA3]|uniref:serine/threonine-protein kinase n=1 Tax=Frankia sp. QA3 TaxID=710111 RepID=UPI000269C8D5|nr:serine/threonine-protein kinase [Frankia sp. QA3]EIV94878.1 serine/threonine protein kinase [Frankia sp. QA3]